MQSLLFNLIISPLNYHRTAGQKVPEYVARLMKLYKSYSDADLTALIKAGNALAFSTLYARYWSVIYAHVYKILRNHEEAQDIVQEVFSNIWLKSHTLNPESNIAGLLYSAARNRVLDLIKHQHIKNDYLSSFAVYLEKVDPNTVDQVDEKALLVLIAKEIENLPPKMREIFEMSRKDNLSHKQIAETLQISSLTVKKQVQNALKIIKKKLNGNTKSILFLIFFR